MLKIKTNFSAPAASLFVLLIVASFLALSPYKLLSLQTNQAQGLQIKVDNPLGEESQDFNFEQVATKIIEHLNTFIAFVAIAVLIIAGILYIISQGDEQRVTTAKKAMTGAAIGLAVVLAAPTLLKELYEIFGQTITGEDPGNVANAKRAKEIVSNAANLILSVLGMIGIISLIWGGLLYLTSGGNEDQAKRGKKQIVYSIIGLFIAISALIIVKQVDQLIRGE